jgi:hypothetical protein
MNQVIVTVKALSLNSLLGVSPLLIIGLSIAIQAHRSTLKAMTYSKTIFKLYMRRELSLPLKESLELGLGCRFHLCIRTGILYFHCSHIFFVGQ